MNLGIIGPISWTRMIQNISKNQNVNTSSGEQNYFIHFAMRYPVPAPIPSAPPLPRSEANLSEANFSEANLPIQERLILKGRRRAQGVYPRNLPPLRPHPPTASPPPPPLGSVAAALMRQPVSKREKPKLAPKPNLTQILVAADKSTGKLLFQNSTLKRRCWISFGVSTELQTFDVAH